MSGLSIETAKVGDQVRFDEDRLWFTVQARDARFIVCTRRTPFRDDDCPTYTVVDLKHSIRGPDNYVFCHGYVTRDLCERRLRRLRASARLRAYLRRREPGVITPDDYGMAVSLRHRIPLSVAKVTRGSTTRRTEQWPRPPT